MLHFLHLITDPIFWYSGAHSQQSCFTSLLFQHSCVLVRSLSPASASAQTTGFDAYSGTPALPTFRITAWHPHPCPALPSKLMCLYFFGLWPWVFPTLIVTFCLSQLQPDPTTKPNPPMFWLQQCVITLLWVSVGIIKPQVGEEVGNYQLMVCFHEDKHKSSSTASIPTD